MNSTTTAQKTLNANLVVSLKPILILSVVASIAVIHVVPPACSQDTTSNPQEVAFVERLKKRDQTKALHYVQERLDSEPTNVYLLLTAANWEMRTDQAELSSKQLEKYFSLNPKSQNADIYVSLANAYVMTERQSKALSTYNTAISKLPDNGMLYCERGCVYANSHQLDKGIIDLNKAVALQPKNSHFLKERGELYVQKGDYAKALVDFTSVIKMGDAKAFTYTQRAEIYKKLNREDLAKKDMEQADKLARKILDDGP